MPIGIACSTLKIIVPYSLWACNRRAFKHRKILLRMGIENWAKLTVKRFGTIVQLKTCGDVVD